jgi:hypothetical protein
MIAGHPVDNPPIEAVLAEKPPVPTLALWVTPRRHRRRRRGACAPGECDREIELDCSHMGFAVSGRAYPKVVEAIRSF